MSRDGGILVTSGRFCGIIMDMVKNSFFIASWLVAVLVISGCWHRTAPLPDFNQKPVENPVATSTAQVEPTAEPTRFYPKNTPIVVDGQVVPAPLEPERDSFVITPELRAKLYLTDIYNPGVCYGLPGPVPAISVETLLARNRQLETFLRSQYSLKEDLDVYTKIKQINAISLEANRTGYQFNFTDAQCCTLKAYQGQVDTLSPKLKHEVEREDIKENPC